MSSRNSTAAPPAVPGVMTRFHEDIATLAALAFGIEPAKRSNADLENLTFQALVVGDWALGRNYMAQLEERWEEEEKIGSLEAAKKEENKMK